MFFSCLDTWQIKTIEAGLLNGLRLPQPYTVISCVQRYRIDVSNFTLIINLSQRSGEALINIGPTLPSVKHSLATLYIVNFLELLFNRSVSQSEMHIVQHR